MAEGGQKRSPTSHRTPGQIKRQIKGYDARPANKKKRAARNAARKKLMDEGAVKKGDGKDVHHKRPLKHGGTNARKNLAPVKRSQHKGK